MLNILLLIKFITIFALTNLLYYRLEGIIISKRKRAVETIVIAVSSALTISVIGNFSLSPMIALVLIAVISVYHSLSKHKAIMKSLFCIFDIYAVLLFASSLLGAIVMTVMFFIQSDYHKVSVAVCTSVLQVILAIAVGKSNFPKAVLKPLSKRKEILSTGITAILFAMAAIVKVDHDLLAKYAEVNQIPIGAGKKDPRRGAHPPSSRVLAFWGIKGPHPSCTSALALALCPRALWV